jgi:hypothetical protein
MQRGNIVQLLETMKLQVRGFFRNLMGFLLVVLWAANGNVWVFFSGVVSGLGANIFATRALAVSPRTCVARMWLEFAVFLGSAAFGLVAGEFRRRAEENWRAGGCRPDHKEGFLRRQLPGLGSCSAGALLLLAAGMLLIADGGN